MGFNPNRLAIARKRKLLTNKALAARLGVTQQTMVRWDKSEDEPTPDNVKAISRELGYPVGFFFGNDIDEPSAMVASFRSQAAMSAAHRDAALAAGSLGFEIADWVAERFDLPEVKMLDLHLYEPEAAAMALRQEWGLGEKPVSNMVHLLESKGVRVFALAENTRHVNAFSLWRRDQPYVFLNTVKSAESSRFDAAHELAHLVLHLDGKVRGRLAEDQANRFASAFLMPRGDMLGSMPRVFDLCDLVRYKKRWRVSVAALNYRAHKIGLSSDWTYRDMCIEISRLGYNTKEPKGIERESSVVWEKVLKALWGEQKTHMDIATELFIPSIEVSDLVFGMLNAPDAEEISGGSALEVFNPSGKICN